jgi:hypothetical protein
LDARATTTHWKGREQGHGTEKIVGLSMQATDLDAGSQAQIVLERWSLTKMSSFSIDVPVPEGR